MRFEISTNSIQNNLGLLRREGNRGNNNNKFTEQSGDSKKVEEIIIIKCTVDRVMTVKQLRCSSLETLVAPADDPVSSSISQFGSTSSHIHMTDADSTRTTQTSDHTPAYRKDFSIYHFSNWPSTDRYFLAFAFIFLVTDETKFPSCRHVKQISKAEAVR